MEIKADNVTICVKQYEQTTKTLAFTCHDEKITHANLKCDKKATKYFFFNLNSKCVLCNEYSHCCYLLVWQYGFLIISILAKRSIHALVNSLEIQSVIEQPWFECTDLHVHITFMSFSKKRVHRNSERTVVTIPKLNSKSCSVVQIGRVSSL